MRKSTQVFALVLVLGIGASFVCPAQTGHWTLSCKCYRVLGNFDGKTSLTDPIMSGFGDHEAEADPMEWIRQLDRDQNISLFNTADLTDVGGAHLVADATGWSWNGSPEPPTSEAFPKVEMVAAPKLTSEFGQSFTIEMNPSESIEYFERTADGLYRIQTSETKTGVNIGAESVERGSSERVILRDFGVYVSTVTKREPLEGSHLDIGKPIISTRSFKKTFSVKPGLNYGLMIHFDNYGTLLVRFGLTLD